MTRIVRTKTSTDPLPSVASSSSYGSTSKLAAAISAAKESAAASSGYERANAGYERANAGYDRALTSDRVASLTGLTSSASSASAAGQEYGAQQDELDPSKLDLKIVHLPVSVLKRLVGSGELALPSFQKKKK